MADSKMLAKMDFFSLLREIERRTPDAPRLGTSNDASSHRLSIRQNADLSFASREVAAVRVSASHYDISVRHFGMFAPYGPLPIFVTEHARTEQLNHNSEAFCDFITMLTQRHALLWYRAWGQLQPMVGCDRPLPDNSFKQKLNQVAGITVDTKGPTSHTLLRQNWPAAWLPGRASWRDLQQMLTHYFSAPVQLFPFAGRWIRPMEYESAHRMGLLGSTRLGKGFFDAQHALRIEVGPLTSPACYDWQRGERKLLMLASMCQMFVRHQINIRIDLLMETSSSQTQAVYGKLGRNSLIKPRNGILRQHVWQTPA